MAKRENHGRDKTGFFRRLAEFMIGHRVTAVVGILLATGFLMSRIGTLKLDADPDLWVPQDHPVIKTTNEIEDTFGGKYAVVIGVSPKQGDVYQPGVLAKIKEMQARIELMPNVIRSNVFSLAARKSKVINSGADGMVVRQMMDKVPAAPAELARLKADFAAMPIYKRLLVSDDASAVAIVADFKEDKATHMFSPLLAQLKALAADEMKDGTVDIHLGGFPLIGAWSEHYMMQMPLYFGLALLVIMGIQFWSFRSFQGMLLPMLTGLLSVFWALGFMGLAGIHMDPMNTCTPILILAIAAGHAIQILKRYYEEYSRALAQGLSPEEANREAVAESIHRVGPIMVTAGLIAIISFLSLTVTGIPMVQHFGFFAGLGVLSALILEMTFIPALRSLLKAPKVKEVAGEKKYGILDRALAGLAGNLVGGRAPWMVAGGALLIGAMAAGVAYVKVDNNFLLYFKPHSEVRLHNDFLNSKFAGTQNIEFLVTTAQPDGIKDPAVLRGMEKLQAALEQDSMVGKTQSLVDSIKRMNQAMHEDKPEYYSVPDSHNLVAQYLLLYSLSGDPADFDNFVDNDYRRAVVTAYMKTNSATYAKQLTEKMQPVITANFPQGTQVQVGGSLPQVMVLNDLVVRDKARNMLQMALVVFLLASLVLRSPVGGLFVLTPLVAVIAANFGVMGWLGIPIDIGAVTTASMAIGVGSDYEIYLLFRFKEELEKTGSVLAATRESLMTSGKAIIFVALSVIGGYGVLQASGFAFYTNLSTLVTTTMTISALFALFFLRALMMVFKPKFIFGEKPQEYFDHLEPVQGGVK